MHEETERTVVLDFIRTPFSVRCNVVKFWRPLPRGLWTVLATPEDRARSVRRERYAMIGVAVIAAMLLFGFAGVALCVTSGEALRCYPLLGRSMVPPVWLPSEPGWHSAPWPASMMLASYVVVPSLLGWVFVRLVWIPVSVVGRPAREAALAFARYVSEVYLYVYLMIIVGAALLSLLILLSPAGTELIRWCLWIFLFGESFFVPAVVWLRLVIKDPSGDVFGRYRYGVMVLYLLLFVMIPIAGMVYQFA